MNIAIIVAAGKSKRTKGINKLFYKINDNPLIFYTIKIFESHPQINKIIIVTRKENCKKFKEIINKYKFTKIVSIIEGGKERQDSCFLGLKEADKLGTKQNDLILFHNGANPLVLKNEITNVINAAKKYKVALLGQMAKDTIKELDKNGVIVKTIDRNKIFLAQTPQVIEFTLAKKAFKAAQEKNFQGTDDVSLVEKLGKKVKAIPCSSRNIKATTREDLQTIKTFL